MQFINKHSYKILLLLGFVLFLLIRLPGLGYDFTNSDAGRWHTRSEKFLTALKTGDFKSTYQHYQPGVTLMWVNALVKQVAFNYQLTYTNEPKTLLNADWFPVIDGLSKIAIVVILFLLLLYQAFLITKLFGKNVTVIFVFGIALEPYLAGMDRWFHLTSLETYLGISSFLTLLLWLKTQKIRHLVISAVLLAFSYLSKLTSLILLPLFLSIIFFSTGKKAFKKPVLNILLYLLVLVVVPFLIFPALWVDAARVVGILFGTITGSLNNSDPGPFLQWIHSPVFYLLILLIKSSPLTLAFLLLALVNIRNLKTVWGFKYVLLYLVTFFVLLTIPTRKVDRYFIALLPPIILLISLYVSGLQLITRFLFLLASAVFMVWVSQKYYPMYSAYYSPVVGGTGGALKMGLYSNSGEYYSQAAFYLNTLGRKTHVLVPFNVDTFRYYFKGVLDGSFTPQTDYVVTSTTHFTDVPQTCTTKVKMFGPKNENVVAVFKCKP